MSMHHACLITSRGHKLLENAFPYNNRDQGVDIQDLLTHLFQCKTSHVTETGSGPKMIQFQHCNSCSAWPAL